MLDKFITFTDCIPAFGSLDRQTLIDHVGYLRKHKLTKTVPVDIRYSYPEKNNFYAYCRLANIDPLLIYPIMLLNDIASPMDFDEHRESLLIPDVSTVASILESARL